MAPPTSPFDITDSNLNHILGTLTVEEDYTQLRNTIFVRGGRYEGNQTTKTQVADGGTDSFPTDYKFAELPTVKLNGTTQNVGNVNLNDMANYDALWSFQEKYVEFANQPSDGDTIEMTGIPLLPIYIKILDQPSVDEFGKWEYYIEDEDIQTRDEAAERGRAETKEWGQPVKRGSFETYKDGLRAGQLIDISVSRLGVDDTFVLQDVHKNLVRPNDDSGEAKLKYRVKFANIKDPNLIKVLQNNLFEDNLAYDEQTENQLSYRDLGDTMAISDAITNRTTTSEPYKYGDGTEYGFGVYG